MGGQTDWFLPSIDELNALCKWAFNDTVHLVCNDGGGDQLLLTNGGFSSNYYWSSSENGDSGAWLQTFGDGNQTLTTKYDGFPVRPVRAF